jgi:hypothetical protein
MECLSVKGKFVKYIHCAKFIIALAFLDISVYAVSAYAEKASSRPADSVSNSYFTLFYVETYIDRNILGESMIFLHNRPKNVTALRVRLYFCSDASCSGRFSARGNEHGICYYSQMSNEKLLLLIAHL